MESEDPIIIITVPPSPRTSMAVLESDGSVKAGNARWFNSKEEAIAYLQSLE